MLTVNELDQLQDALLVGAKIAAMHAGFVTDNNNIGETGAYPEADSLTDISLEPGAVRILPAGTDIKFNSPSSAMRVQLKGINRVSKKLADGSRVTYFYAWKGGPRLPGRPGSAEFVDAYNAAIAEKVRQPAGTIQAVLNAYQESPKYLDLADRTRKDYVRQIRQIESEFADFPLAGLSDRRTRGEFLAWRDKLAIKSRRQADYTFSTFAAIMAWAADRGLVSANPCARPGKLYRSKRAESIWFADDEAAMQKGAPKQGRTPGGDSRSWSTQGSTGRRSTGQEGRHDTDHDKKHPLDL